MYQGHKTRADYVKAWKAHVRDLRWMWADSLPSLQDANIRMDELHADIERAADKLQAAGHFEAED